ncbi:MAG: class II aldolase/adducin family protein [Candidatus Methylomirabilota bacterium]|jgi:L-fuculose-phosphate aldolase
MIDQRKQVVRTAVSLLEAGLVSGTAGNVSVREVGTQCFLITPSAVNYRVMGAQDIVQVDLVNGSVKGQRRPSSERELHRQIYKTRADVMAVIHHHSPYATAISVARKTIPNILDEGIDLTPIPTVEYCLAGSPELASKVAAQFAEGRNAVLLANHGAVVVGENLKDALHRSREVERLAQIYVWAETLGGAVPLEEWAVERSRDFLTQYRKAMAAGATLQPSQAAEDSESLSLADLVRFSFRSWITFGSLIHNLVLQRLRR